MTWRERARPVIQNVIAEVGTDDMKKLRKALSDAYPFWEKENYPYKVWLDEIHKQLNPQTHPGLTDNTVRQRYLDWRDNPDSRWKSHEQILTTEPLPRDHKDRWKNYKPKSERLRIEMPPEITHTVFQRKLRQVCKRFKVEYPYIITSRRWA